MGKMLGTGISGSALPFRRKAPAWATMAPSNVIEMIVKNAKKGLTPSQIGVLMRDVYGTPHVRFLTGKKILRILKKRGAAPSLPEDLYHLIKKAVAMRKHLNKNRKDTDCKLRFKCFLIATAFLIKWYKSSGKLGAAPLFFKILKIFFPVKNLN
jgi:small subunit ribosomal protein S13e